MGTVRVRLATRREDGDGEEKLRGGSVPRRCSLTTPGQGGKGQVAGEEPRPGARGAPRGRRQAGPGCGVAARADRASRLRLGWPRRPGCSRRLLVGQRRRPAAWASQGRRVRPLGVGSQTAGGKEGNLGTEARAPKVLSSERIVIELREQWRWQVAWPFRSWLYPA